MKFVSIVMGSKSDYEVMKSCSDTFEAFGVQRLIYKMLRKKERKYLLLLLVWPHI